MCVWLGRPAAVLAVSCFASRTVGTRQARHPHRTPARKPVLGRLQKDRARTPPGHPSTLPPVPPCPSTCPTSCPSPVLQLSWAQDTQDSSRTPASHPTTPLPPPQDTCPSPEWQPLLSFVLSYMSICWHSPAARLLRYWTCHNRYSCLPGAMGSAADRGKADELSEIVRSLHWHRQMLMQNCDHFVQSFRMGT